MMLDLITQERGLWACRLKNPAKCLACRHAPVERWRTGPRRGSASIPLQGRTRSCNALTETEAEAVLALIKSPAHAGAGCRELAPALQQSPIPTYVSQVTVWAYERELRCNGPAIERQVSQGAWPARS